MWKNGGEGGGRVGKGVRSPFNICYCFKEGCARSQESLVSFGSRYYIVFSFSFLFFSLSLSLHLFPYLSVCLSVLLFFAYRPLNLSIDFYIFPPKTHFYILTIAVYIIILQ